MSPDVVTRWDRAFEGGSDKRFPSLDLVRLEKWFFGAKPGRVLDYGCGSGTNLIYLLELGYAVDGADASAAAIRLVGRKLSARPELRDRANLTHIGAATRRLPYKDQTFDYLICFSVLS
ncbi:MAG: class I SAM-dependent methyltransferase, partial [Verrucomicrobia bacterium]|nr:class I SAM-dependent methyltransferase [Verrucomicrobiota bacterium]